MTSSIHNIRLNQLKQLIQDTIYRLDKPQRDHNDLERISSQPIPEIEAVLQKLNEWRACRPVQPSNTKALPLLSEEQLGLDYHEVRSSLTAAIDRELTGSVCKCCFDPSLLFAKSPPTMLHSVPSQRQAAARYVPSVLLDHC
jgi:hypothetical protein